MPNLRQASAESRRQWLLAALGPVCVKCGATNCLTFDCIRPTGDDHHRMNKSNRMTYYTRQATQGNLQVLCSDCNSRKGSKPQPKYLPVTPTGSPHE